MYFIVNCLIRVFDILFMWKLFLCLFIVRLKINVRDFYIMSIFLLSFGMGIIRIFIWFCIVLIKCDLMNCEICFESV